jgi:tetratricopeptide (TPR) repeat protein
MTTRGITVETLARAGAAELAQLVALAAPDLLSGNGGLLAPLLPRLRALESLERHADPWVLLVVGFARHDADFTDPGATALAERALELFRQRGDRRGEGYALYTLGNQAVSRGELPEAGELWEAGRQLLGAESAAYAQALCNSSLGAYGSGDLRRAVVLAEQGLAASVQGGWHRAAGAARVYLAGYQLWTGDFARAESALDLADESFQAVTDPAERYEWPLGQALGGVLAALRGHRVPAEARFSDALRAADAVDAAWIRNLVLVLRAEHTAGWAPQRSLVEAQSARAELEKHDDDWWAGVARLATGVALTQCGNHTAAANVFEEALSSGTLIPLERARCSLLLGEALLRAAPAPDRRVGRPPDGDRAVRLLRDARDRLEAAGARFWATRACAALALVDTSAGVRHWQRAHDLAGDDPAFERLLRGDVALRVEMLGRARVVVGGRAVSFPTRHALHLVLALAAAGGGGLSAETLHTWLWPDADRTTGARRLKTVLWQARRGLGAAAGRLRRQGVRTTLSLVAGECDLADAIAAAEALLASPAPPAHSVAEAGIRLSRPVMAGEEHADWIADLQHRVDAIRARLDRHEPDRHEPHRHEPHRPKPA